MQFWDSIDYNKARKVLVIPNITNSSNIEKDSFIDVIYNHIKGLEKYGDYFWHVLIPTGNVTKKLNLPNVKQHQIDIPGDMMNQRSFPSDKLISLLRDIDYDVIYSHLPDWVQVGRYRKSVDTKIIGYTHWWEMKSSNGIDRREGKPKWLWLPVELLGVSQMDVCYLNTQDQKNRVLEEAKEWFNDEFVLKLDSILKVWNLGVNSDKIVDTPSKEKENIIVFNHRAAAYKGYPKFLELMKEYRTQRQDFKVWIPQLNGSPTESWIDNTKVPKHEYYERLQRCKVGIQMRQSNYGWSVAATDCLMNGTPMIYQESLCYREIEPNGLFFTQKKDLFKTLDEILDNDNYRIELEIRSIERARELSNNENSMLSQLHTELTNQKGGCYLSKYLLRTN
jgi:glycosyltransferase involved in cell wall biosynthesis